MSQRETDEAQAVAQRNDEVDRHFEDIVAVLAPPKVQRTWEAATELERRALIDEFVEEISVLPDYLHVNVHGAPPLHVRYQEVGLKESGFGGVGGGT